MFRLFSFEASLSVLLIVGLFLQFASATERGLQDPEAANLQDVIAADKDLSVTSSTFSAPDRPFTSIIAGTEIFTVFAAVNTAFSQLSSELVAKVIKPPYIKHLESVLGFHVIEDVIDTRNLSVGEKVLTMFNGDNLTIAKTFAGNVTVIYVGNQSVPVTVNVTQADIEASNGIVQKIDGVLLPRFVFTLLVDLASQLEMISIMTELLTKAFPNGFGSQEEYTILAPHNDAFAALEDGVLTRLKEDPTELLALLSNHILNGVYPSTLMLDGGILTTYNANTLAVSTKDNNTFISDGTIKANITVPDKLAFDGIIHIIDKVLLNSYPGNLTTAPPTNATEPVVTTSPPNGTSDASSLLLRPTFAICMGMLAALSF